MSIYPIGKQKEAYNAFTENIVGSVYSNNSRQKLSYEGWDRMLFDILMKAKDGEQYEIDLQEYLKGKQLPTENINLPDSLNIRFSILNKDEKGEKVFIRPSGFSSAINILGRFAQSNPDIRQKIKDIAAFETQKSLLHRANE